MRSLQPALRRAGLLLPLLPVVLIWLLLSHLLLLAPQQGEQAVETFLRKLSSQPPHISQDFNTSKKILYFNDFFSITDWNFGLGSEPFSVCPQSNCHVTRDRQLLSSLAEFDAILFHARAMDKRIVQVPSQERRRPGQRYVFFLMESPLNDSLNYTNKRFHNFFNWTMTYRLDSDLPRPYGWFSPLSSPPLAPPSSPPWLRPRPPSPATLSRLGRLPKPRLAAWMVSNCNTHSNREDYVQLLKKHITVDVFGACGDLECGASNGGASNTECDDRLERDYMFYLSFENSMCTDYVTEKFYRALSRDIVPVVLGGANYSSLAPPGSYISALDFESPAHLARELLRLADSPEEYRQFFWWKDHYSVHHSPEARAALSMCDLCKALHDQDRVVKVYPSLGSWWWGQGRCTRKGQFPWAQPRSTWGQGLLSLLPSGAKQIPFLG